VSATLFGEGPGGFVVSGEPGALGELGERVRVRRLGRVGGRALRIALPGETIELALDALSEAHSRLAELFS
jgi:phosphoribosylformylglycinamidine synthase